VEDEKEDAEETEAVTGQEAAMVTVGKPAMTLEAVTSAVEY